MKAPPAADAPDAALERARQHGIRVAPLSDELWRVESAAPTLRGPYMVAVVDGLEPGACECPGGRFEAICHHRAAVYAAIGGDYPICDLDAIRGPALETPARRETPEERRQRMIAEHNAAHQARMATPEARITAADHAMFDYGG